MSIRFRPLLLVCALALTSCSRQSPISPVADSPADPGIPRIDTSELDRLEALARQPGRAIESLAAQSQRVYVPAGSVDAIAAAIHQAGNGGLVVLRSGLHTEHATVPVDRRVTVLGENGATVQSSAGGLDGSSPVQVTPAFHVTASGAAIWGLQIAPAADDGNCAVLIDGANDVLVFHNNLSRFQLGVIVVESDRPHIWSNAIVTSGAWQTGAVASAFSIVLVSGARGSVLHNDVSNALFGIWACGPLGTVAFNSAHGSLVGIILCKVPEGSLRLPDGRVVGAPQTATQWVAAFNQTDNNLTTGFLVIDSANHNLVASNESSGNGTYDVELTGDSYRFGFLTPASFSNTFIAGEYPDIEVKNCGNDNRIIGGHLVDNTLEPCD